MRCRILKQIVLSVCIASLIHSISSTMLYAATLPDGKSAQQELIKRIQYARSISSGIFTRLDKQTLKFEGHINRDTYENYMKAIDPDVTTMIINSSGGNSYEGVLMGIDMAKRNLTVIVDGIAGSSAANYLFVAGTKKVIRNGFVGFHGNARAYAVRGGRDQRADIMASIKKNDIQLSKEQIDTLVNEANAESAKTIQLEKQFFKSLGISQELFDLTQQEGKGLPEHLNMDFEFLLPSNRTMERFGIGNVSGRQDVEVAEQLMKVIYY